MVLGREGPSSRWLSAKRFAVMALGFALSGAGAWYALRDVEFGRLVASASRVRVLPLVAAVAMYWGGLIAIRALLVRRLLAPVGEVGRGVAYRYICIGFLVNTVLPLRMGELARIAGISRATRIGFAEVTGSLAVERMLDLSMAALVGIAAIQVAPLPLGVRAVVLGLGCALLAGFAVFAFLVRSRLEERAAGKSGRIRTRLWNLLVRFTAGFAVLGSLRGLLKAAALAAAIWTIAMAVMFLRLAAFELPLSIPLVLVLLTGISLGVSLPSAPGYVGVYHAFAAAALTLFGVEPAVAVGFAIFCHLVDVVPSIALGAICMALEGVHFSDLERMGDGPRRDQ